MSGDITITLHPSDVADPIAAALAAQPCCPLCGCGTREAQAIAFHSNRYIRAAAGHLHVEERALFDRMPSHRCVRCGTLYFDPWLGPAFARELYQRIFPHHNLGWYEFYHFVHTPETALQRADLVRRLRAAVPSLETYGEVGCPFEGLLPYFATRRYRAGGEEFYDYPGEVRFDPSVPGNPDVRGNAINLERIGRACANALNQLQLARAFPVRRLRQRYLHRVGSVECLTPPGVKTVYLERESSVLWGSHCTSLNVQCRRMAEDVFRCGAARVSDHAAGMPAVDLVGVFNALDHYMKPLDLLHELLAVSRFVYLEGHTDTEAGKQHPFVLDERSLAKLSWPGVTCIDRFTEREPGSYSVLLCRE